MEHADVLELIEIAAAEPDGLVRLTAGDTPDAAAVAGHLAGCEACAADLARTARTSTIAREAIRELPDPALRARTLAFVRDVGIDRSARQEATGPRLVPASGAVTAPVAAPISITAPAPEAVPGRAPVVLAPKSVRSRTPFWAAAGVAAVLIAGVAGFAAGGAANTGSPSDNPAVAMAAAQTTMHIAEQQDAVHLALASTGGGMAKGNVIYSPATGELSMTATGLDPAPAGTEYACWVEQNGQRRRIGLMYVEGHDGTWAGPVSGLADLAPGTAFGVTVVPAGGGTGTPILRGG
jgi:hypothetical protein